MMSIFISEKFHKDKYPYPLIQQNNISSIRQIYKTEIIICAFVATVAAL